MTTEAEFLGMHKQARSPIKGPGSLSISPPRTYPLHEQRNIAKEELYLRVETLEAGLAACRAHLNQLTRDLPAR